MNALINVLVIISLVTFVASDCVQPVSGSIWTIYSANIVSYGIDRGYRKVANLTGYLLANVECGRNTSCQINSTIVGAMDEQIFRREDVQPFLKILIENKNGGSTEIFKLNFNDEIYESALAKADYYKGYYYDKTKSILHLWYFSNTALLTFYEGRAEESFLNNNTSVRYVTFLDENNTTYTLQLNNKNNGDIWTTDQSFLFLKNNTKSNMFSSNLKLYRKIIPQKNLTKCADVDENSEEKNGEFPTITVDLTYVIIAVIVLGTIIIFCVLYKIMKNRKNRQDQETLSVFKKIRDRAFSQNVHYKRQSDHIYTEPIEVNEYAIPGTDDQKFYDLEGRRVPAENLKTNAANINTYDYAYSNHISDNRDSDFGYVQAVVL